MKICSSRTGSSLSHARRPAVRLLRLFTFFLGPALQDSAYCITPPGRGVIGMTD